MLFAPCPDDWINLDLYPAKHLYSFCECSDPNIKNIQGLKSNLIVKCKSNAAWVEISYGRGLSNSISFCTRDSSLRKLQEAKRMALQILCNVNIKPFEDD